MLKRIKRKIRRMLGLTKKNKAKKRKKKNPNVVTVSKELQVPYKEALALMERIRNDYGISFSDFSKNKLYLYEGAELEDAAEATATETKKKNQRAIKNVAKVTGWTIEEVTDHVEHVKAEFGYSPRAYWRHQLYEMTDEQILAFKTQNQALRETRIKEAMEASGWTKSRIKEHMAYCNTHYNISNVEYYVNFRCWELSDDELEDLAVDEDSRTLSRRYNENVSILTNKLKFNNRFRSYLGRKFWVNRDTSFEEFLRFTEGLDKVFCKPLNLSSGVGTKIVKIPAKETEKIGLYKRLIAESELLAEEFIVQHQDMNRVYDGCVNTIRLTMIRTDKGCQRLWSFARFGSNGIVDNFHSGGIAVAVDVDTGIVLTDAMNAKGEFFAKHPVTGVTFKGFQIPYWDKVIKLTEEAMLSQEKISYVGWDVAICPDKVVIVEGNSTPQVGVYQTLLIPEGQRKLYMKYL